MSDVPNDLPPELKQTMSESEQANVMLMLIMRRLGISIEEYMKAVQEWVVMRANEEGK